MKNIKSIISLFIVVFFIACNKEDLLFNTDSIDAPKDISALMTIKQDNSGKVTFLPNGEGISKYEIYFGDATVEPAYVNPGEKADHIYTEGNYQVKIVGITLNGKKTQVIQPLSVSFLAPTNLVATVLPGANLSVSVTATANLETYFQVYYGDNPSQVPVDFNEGQTVTHTYASPGTYQVKVVALSGGAATTQTIQSITVTNLTAAPAPTVPASNVISMFSNTYTNVPVDTWRTSWSQANLQDLTIQGNATKKYSNLDYVGIEAVANQINATSMTHFHTDFWSSDCTQFKVKLVDFGADGSFAGGDDKEHEITINAPAQNTWVSLDIPLSSFTGLTTRGHIAQLIYAGSPSGNTTVYIDNVYFYNQVPTLTTAAPTPTYSAANVISMFSNAYTNVPVNTWRTSWSSATLQDLSIAGSDVKKYSTLDFVGIETTTNQINATAMTHFHTDVWSADFSVFKIKLVDFGADGAYAGGDDKEHEIVINNPTRAQWVSLDIPLSSFTGLTTRGHIAQLIYAATPTGNNTVYVDNVYFHN